MAEMIVENTIQFPDGRLRFDGIRIENRDGETRVFFSWRGVDALSTGVGRLVDFAGGEALSLIGLTGDMGDLGIHSTLRGAEEIKLGFEYS